MYLKRFVVSRLILKGFYTDDGHVIARFNIRRPVAGVWRRHILAGEPVGIARSVDGQQAFIDAEGTNIKSVGVGIVCVAADTCIDVPFDIGLRDQYPHVEIIRGPGSALYGADAFSGVISFKSFDTNENVLSADISYGTNDYYDSNLRFNRNINEKFSFSVSLGFNGIGDQNISYDYQDDTTNEIIYSKKEESHNRKTIIAKLKWKNKNSIHS